jgi:outer membrane lipoprotein carrier protein
MSKPIFSLAWMAAALVLVASAPDGQAQSQAQANLQSHSYSNDARQLAARVDARYNSIKTLQAGFTETYSGGGARRTESGTLLLKKPGRMRWEYTSPRRKLFVTDGATAWFYVPGEAQARRTPLKSLDDLRSPLRLLLGHSHLEKELRGLSLAPDVKPVTPGGVVLRGIPVGLEDRVSQVLLECDGDGWVRRLVMDELDGSTTEFRFSAQKENVPLSDAGFKFAPPAGVEVLQGGALTP